jgi:hypothetical protein
MSSRCQTGKHRLRFSSPPSSCPGINIDIDQCTHGKWALNGPTALVAVPLFVVAGVQNHSTRSMDHPRILEHVSTVHTGQKSSINVFHWRPR